jgi:hypothetical protein
VTVSVRTIDRHHPGEPVLSEREEMDIVAAYGEVGTFRGAAEMCGTCHKTVRRVMERHAAGGVRPEPPARRRNYEDVRQVVAKRVASTRGRITAKRLLPEAKAAGYEARPGTSGGW